MGIMESSDKVGHRSRDSHILALFGNMAALHATLGPNKAHICDLPSTSISETIELVNLVASDDELNFLFLSYLVQPVLRAQSRQKSRQCNINRK